MVACSTPMHVSGRGITWHPRLVSKLPEPFASHVHAFPVAQVRPSDDIDYLTSASWWYRPGHDIARASDSIRQVFTGRVFMRGRNHHLPFSTARFHQVTDNEVARHCLSLPTRVIVSLGCFLNVQIRKRTTAGPLSRSRIRSVHQHDATKEVTAHVRPNSRAPNYLSNELCAQREGVGDAISSSHRERSQGAA